jgi:hypothetical protein
VDVSITAAAAGHQPAIGSIDAVAPVERPAKPVSTGDPIHGSRMSVLVDLIASLTGREVKLVPPSAYLVSKPTPPAPPIEIVAPAGLITELGEGSGPIEIAVASVLRTGTSKRMLLDTADDGMLRLRASDVDL